MFVSPLFRALGKARKRIRRVERKRQPVRCTLCKARRTLYQRLDDYVRMPRCECGNRKWFVDKWMLRRGRQQRCMCPAYHFPHRKDGGLCMRDEAKLMEFIKRRYPHYLENA